MEAFFIDEYDCDRQRVALPHPQTQIIVRFGPSARNGLDAHAFGMHQSARRKFIRRGQWSVTARLHLGASKAVLDVPASALAGSILSLDELWGHAAVDRLLDRLSDVSAPKKAVAIVERAIAERLASAQARDAHTTLALEAARRLADASVRAVAVDLGVSERHLRRVFNEAIGMSPKVFARLARFRRALRVARGADHRRLNWASIAAAAGYYDQAHLIDEFRTISGVTPRTLLGEIGTAS